MALERTYVIPLRPETQKVATYRKSKKAINAIKKFVTRHMKPADAKSIKIMNEVNLEIWKHGIRNPPGKIKVNCRKDDKGVVEVQLFGKKFREAPKVEEKKGLAQKVAEKVGTKIPAKSEKPEAPKAEEKKPEAKAEPAKEEKKEAPKAEEKKETPKPTEKKPEAKPAEKKETPKPAAKPAPKPEEKKS